MMMLIRRLLTVSVLSGLVLVGAAAPAFAHAELTASNPAKGASLATAPTEVSLTFDEPVTLGQNPIAVTGPGGASWFVGKPTIAGPVITVPVHASGPAGAYTLTYRVIADDGDDVTGSVAFTMTAAAGPVSTSKTPPTTTDALSSSAENASATTDDDTGLPVWVWIVIAVVVVIGGAAIAFRASRSRDT
jgi:copper resistance protein C